MNAGKGTFAHGLTVSRTVVGHDDGAQGFTGECGLRGGYFEAIGFDDEVLHEVVKMASITLCSGVPGQIATGLM